MAGGTPSEGFAAAVRAADPDRALSVLYAPAPARSALWALYAFDAEIAGLRGRVREVLAGEIRLQWWRDAIQAGAPTGHPLTDALLEAIYAFGLPSAALDNYLEARIFDLYDDPMPSRTDLEGYFGETEGAILQLAALVLDARAASGQSLAAGHASCARGVARTLRHLGAQRSRGQCFIPVDILAAAGSSPERFISLAESPERNAVAAMQALGREHLAAFAAAARDLPPSLRPAFLPLAVTPEEFDAAADPSRALDGTMKPVAPWRRHWLTLRHASRGWPWR